MQGVKFKKTIVSIGLQAILILWAVIVLYPVITVFINSFKSQPDFYQNPYGLPFKWIVDNYIQAWEKANFAIYFKNTIFISFTSVAINLLLSSLASYGLARYNFRGNRIILLVLMSGLVLPVQLIIVPLFFQMRDIHLLNNPLSLVFIFVTLGLPISIFILTRFFNTLSKEMEEAARLDGANEFQIFYRIMLPLIRPALATIAILNFVMVWNDFFIPLIFIHKASQRTLTLGLNVFFGQYANDWSYLFAGLIIVVVPLLIVYFILSEQFIEGIGAGAINE